MLTRSLFTVFGKNTESKWFQYMQWHEKESPTQGPVKNCHQVLFFLYNEFKRISSLLLAKKTIRFQVISGQIGLD